MRMVIWNNRIDDMIPAERETNYNARLPETKCIKTLCAMKNREFDNSIKRRLTNIMKNNEELSIKKSATGL